MTQFLNSFSPDEVGKEEFQYTAEFQRPSRLRERAEAVKYHGRSFISVSTIFFAMLEWPPGVAGECPVFCLMGVSLTSAICKQVLHGHRALHEFLQDPDRTQSASSPPLPLAHISQSKCVMLNSEEVSLTHLPGKLVLSIKEAVSPISPPFNRYLAESLVSHRYMTLSISISNIQCRFFFPFIPLAFSMKFSNCRN